MKNSRWILSFGIAMAVSTWAIGLPPEPELLPPSMSEKPAPTPSPLPPTAPLNWPARGDLLYLSVILVGFEKLEACQRLYVTSLDRSNNQITVTTGDRVSDPVFDIRGDYRLIMTPTPRQCWQELRRQAWPIDDLSREELEAKYGRRMPPFQTGSPIDCRTVGRPRPCESRRSIPIVETKFVSPENPFSGVRTVWVILGVFDTKE